MQPIDRIERIDKGFSISEKAAAQLKNLITSGRIPPGEELPAQGRMAKQMGVSRATMREALISLEATGIIEKLPNGRYRVPVAKRLAPTDIKGLIRKDPRTVWEILEVGNALMTDACRLAAERATEEDLNSLGRVIFKLKETSDSEDFFKSSFNRYYIDFYQRICAATKNAIYIYIMEYLSRILEEILPYPESLLRNIPEVPREVFEDLQKVYRSLRNRDAEEAVRWMKKHLAYVFSKFEEITMSLEEDASYRYWEKEIDSKIISYFEVM